MHLAPLAVKLPSTHRSAIIAFASRPPYSAGTTLGAVVIDGQPRLISAQEVRDQIVYYLATRTAKELLIGDRSRGAGGARGSDFAMAWSLAL